MSVSDVCANPPCDLTGPFRYCPIEGCEWKETVGETDGDLIKLLSKLLEGCGVPRSLGVLGAAAQPYTDIRDKLHLFGWTNAYEYETALRKYLREVVFS